MKKLTYRLGILGLVFMSLAAVACGGNEPDATSVAVTAVPTDPPPTATAEPVATNTPVPPTPTVAPTAVPTNTPEPTTAAFETDRCAFDVPPGRDVTCGWLTVPEDRSDLANGRTVRLHVAIFASDNPNPAPDPIVYLEGGPGGDALETIPLVFEQRFSGFLADRDFIMFDQRGTGYAEPSLACPELTDLLFDTLELDLTPEEDLEQSLNVLSLCRSRLAEEGVNLAAYNSAENAADLADLRQALGYDSWNIFGISYGTRLAQTLMRDHPEGLRSVILDSTYPLEVDLIAATPANVRRAYDVLFAGCAADDACRTAYPDLEATFFDLVDQLNAEPIIVPVTYLFTGERFEAPFDGTSLLSILFQSLYSTEIIPVLPQLIYEIRDGSTTTLATLLSSFLLNSEFVSIGMQFSVQCREELVFGSPETAVAAAAEFPELQPLFQASINVGAAAYTVCANWGAGTADPIENQPVTSDIPTLILAGEYDPITPPVWGEQVQANLPNSIYVEFPGIGHGASVSGDCPLSVTLAFLNDPSADLDLSCVADMAGPAFAVPGGEPEPITLVPFTSDIMIAEMSGVIPDGWTEASPGVFTRGRTALDQTFLLQQAAPGFGAAEFLTLLSNQLGLAAEPESVGMETIGDRDWTFYQSELQGVPVDIALAEDENFTYVVILGAEAADRDFLFENAFLPALAALTAE